MPVELAPQEVEEAEELIGKLGVAPNVLKYDHSLTQALLLVNHVLESLIQGVLSSSGHLASTLDSWMCRETLANAKLSRELVNLVRSSGLTDGCEKEQGTLVMMVASTFPSSALSHRPLLMQYITDKKIVTNDQCTAAIKFFKSLRDEQFDVGKFERASGVGIVVTDEEIAAAVTKVFADNEAAIKEQRYHFNFMKLLQPIKAIGDMAWADISKVKSEMNTQSIAMLGPKTAEDEKPREKPKKSKEPKVRHT